ncbi:MAG TPA: transcription termination factor NusA [Candidatus Krumholzibacteria bacterium]|nr:transcription termination factor NusA [Candidatus Krumholzibacteria bacterium]
MSIHFAEAFNQLIRERRLDRAILMDTLTQGFASAVRRKYGPNAEVRIEDDGHGSIELFLVKNVVDAVEDPSIQISVVDAQEYAEGAEAGDAIEINLPFEEFGRNAIQVTKQILMQKIREFERDRVFEEYKDRVNEIVSGSVQQIDRTGILVNLGSAEAFMPKKDQIRRERYQQGSSIRAVVMKVDKEAKGPMITLSRTSPEFLKALFIQEVPEIYEGLIEIKSIAREAGGRSKIAVYSRDDRVDAVGACVGMKGSRVQAVVNELSGERIDIVPWSDDVQTFVSRALSPAKITQVRPDIETKTVTVVVEEDQLSLAIGKEGQNVRLASRLTGWQIELVSSRELEQRQRLQEHLLMPIEEMVGVSDKMAEKLREAGINTVQKLIKTPVGSLLTIPGFGERTVERLMETAQGTVKELEKALEELIRKENEDREEKKRQEKPLFDESMLEAETEEPKKETKKLTAAQLFRDPAEVEAEAAAEPASTEPAEAPAETTAETPAEISAEPTAEATGDGDAESNPEAEDTKD